MQLQREWDKQYWCLLNSDIDVHVFLSYTSTNSNDAVDTWQCIICTAIFDNSIDLNASHRWKFILNKHIFSSYYNDGYLIEYYLVFKASETNADGIFKHNHLDFDWLNCFNEKFNLQPMEIQLNEQVYRLFSNLSSTNHEFRTHSNQLIQLCWSHHENMWFV